MQDSKIKVSIVVPVGSADPAWQDFLGQLPPLPASWELLFICASPFPESLWQDLLKTKDLRDAKIRWHLAKKPGRARQLNEGGRLAKGSWIWFLHADSQIESCHIALIQNTSDSLEDALYYFDLGFLRKGFAQILLNQWGANFRSRVFKMPFGDQGFLIRRNLWLKLGQFNEAAKYGEDHLFVWNCHQHQVRVKRLPLTIQTSPRKYQHRGWLKTTGQHFLLTWKQAFPEIMKLIRLRINGG